MNYTNDDILMEVSKLRFWLPDFVVCEIKKTYIVPELLVKEYITELDSENCKFLNGNNFVPIITRILRVPSCVEHLKINDTTFLHVYSKHLNNKKLFERMNYINSFAYSILMYKYH